MEKVSGVLASTMIEMLSFLVQHLFINGKEIFKFKADNKTLTFHFNFVLEVLLID